MLLVSAIWCPAAAIGTDAFLPVALLGKKKNHTNKECKVFLNFIYNNLLTCDFINLLCSRAMLIPRKPRPVHFL